MHRRLVPALLLCLTLAAPAWAGRPLMIDDAGPVDQGHFEIEAAAAYSKDSDTHHVDVPLGVTYGLLPRLEIGVGFGGQWEHRFDDAGHRESETDFCDVSLAAKGQFLDQDKFFLDQSLAFAAKLPVADCDNDMGSGEVDYDLTWIASRQITERWTADVNAGFTWLGNNDDEDFGNILHYGVATGYQLTPTLQPVTEIACETPVEDHDTTAIGANAGLRFQPLEWLTLDAAVGTRVAGDWPDLTTTVGFTIAF